jgi:predicted transposase YbfD/YdcC
MLTPMQSPLASPHGVFRDVLSLHWREKAARIRRWMEERNISKSLRSDVRCLFSLSWVIGRLAFF